MLYDYNDDDEQSIYQYSKLLENKTFGDVYNMYLDFKSKEYEEKIKYGNWVEEDDLYHLNKNSKGSLGNLLEICYFGYEQNSEQEPDFPKVGIELKQTCIDKRKDGSLTAGERLSITNISYKEEAVENFFASHLWKKMHRMLLVHYLRDRAADRLQYEIKFVNLFTPPEKDLEIIKSDYKVIINKIIHGKAHEISEGDTYYLGACTKGANAEKSLQPQFYNPAIPAKKRNFCLKRNYMNYILHTYILRENVPYDSIIDNPNILKSETFEEHIIKRINNYANKSDKELCIELNREYSNNKSQWSDLAHKMLGIKSNKAEEFEKAGIKVKTIRLEEDGSLKENISLPTFKFIDIANENTWEDSELYNYLVENHFLFIIFKKNGPLYQLLGAQLWNMPLDDLNTTAFQGWQQVRNSIVNGVKFELMKNGTITNNLLKKSENRIIHVRPHSNLSAYKLNCGIQKGDIKKHANKLPNGEWMTTQSFWLNNTYILEQLRYK